MTKLRDRGQSSPQPRPLATQQQIARITKKSDDYRNAYFNHVRVATSYSDVRFFFGQQSVTPLGEPTVTEEICVVMTPEFVTMFMALVATQMNNYEALFGKIRVHPQSRTSTSEDSQGSSKPQ